MNKLIFVAVLCFTLSGLCHAVGPAVGPAFSSYEHKDAQDFSIPPHQKILSISDLYSFLQEFVILKHQQTENAEYSALNRSILACRFDHHPQIVISCSDGLFFVSDDNHYVEVKDRNFKVQVTLFLKLLDHHLRTDAKPCGIRSARIVLSGLSFSTIDFLYTDSTRSSFQEPDPGYPFSSTASARPSEYVVQPGDTLWGISKKTGVPVETIIKLNNLGNSVIFPGQVLILSGSGPSARKNVLGYLVGSTNGDSYATVINHGSKLDFISPAWFWLDLDNPGIFKKDPNFGAFTDAQAKEIVQKAHSMGIKVLGLFHNLTNDPTPSKDMLHRILSEENLRDKCINDIVSKINEYGFDGVNMDFEFIHLKDRDGYSEFMRRLRNALQPLGKLTTIAVPAKFSDTVNTWNGQFDFEKLGKYSDIVMVMTYNENGKWSAPGPVASLPWVEKAMKYAVSKIPPEKVMMGFPTYGYDWTSGGVCKSLSCKKAVSLLNQYKAELQWHTYYASPYFEYTDSDQKRHTVWFENRDSIEMKFMLLDKYQLNGAGMWRLGMETEDFWSILD